MKILLDCDVLLDVLAKRQPFVHHSIAVLDWCEQRSGRACMAWHTVANLTYLFRKSPPEETRQLILELVSFIEVVPTGTAQVKHAMALNMSDLEDALQAAAAVEWGADYIVTRNVDDYKASPIKAILPKDFMALLQ